MEEILWKDIQIGDKMMDGSVVTQIHATHPCECIEIVTSNEDLIVSEDHLFLVDISRLRKSYRDIILKECEGLKIPLEMDVVIFSPDVEVSEDQKEKLLHDFEIGTLDSKYDAKEFVVKDESKINDVKKGLVWLSALEIHRIMNILGQDLTIFGRKKLRSGSSSIISTAYVGQKDAFCISTDTGRYVTNESGIISHNSVTIRNVIFHCLTHGIKIGMIDFKITEFESYKGQANVIGVANNTEEAVELMRICRQLMYQRNKEMAKKGVVDLVDYKPTKKTDRVAVFGREFSENDKLMYRDPEGNEKEITFGQLEEMVYKNE